MAWIAREVGSLVLIGFVLSFGISAALFVTGAVDVSFDSGEFTLDDGTKLYASSIDEIGEIRQRYAGRISEVKLTRSFDAVYRLVAIAVLLATALTFLLYAGWREGPKVRDWLNPSPVAVGIGLLAGVPLFILGAVYSLLLHLIGLPPPDIGDALANLAPMPFIVAVAVVLAPLGEEMYFRGRLLDVLGPRLGPGAAALVSSLAFAVVHGVPVLLPIYAVFGLILVALRRWTDGLIAPIVAHGINNGIGLLVIATIR